MNKKNLIIGGGVVLAILLVLLLFVSLRGGNDDGTSTDTDSSTSDDKSPVTLEWWGLWESPNIVQPLIDKYESENPHITIRYSQESFTQYEANVYTRIQQGSTVGSPSPDIFRMGNSWLNKFEPYLAPMPDSVMSSSDYAKTYYPTAVSDFTGYDGEIYAQPLMIDGLAMFYNKELFAEAGITEPPADWDSVIEISKQLTVTDSSGNITQAGVGLGASSNIMHSADIMNLLMIQNGVDLNSNGDNTVDITSDRAVQAFEYYSDFTNVHKVWSPELRTDLEMFYSGNLAIMFAPSWRVFDILDSNSGIEFGIAPTPLLGTSEIYYSNYWGEAVSSKSVNSEEAWKFINWMAQQKQLEEMYSNSSATRAFGEIYPRESMSSLLIGKPYISAYGTMAPNMTSWKMGEQSYTEEILNLAIRAIAEEDIDTDVALKTANNAINSQLADLETSTVNGL